MRAVKYYLLTIITLGLFSFYWIYLLAVQAKLEKGQITRDTKVFSVLFVVYWAIGITNYYYAYPNGIPLIMEYRIVFLLTAAIAIIMVYLVFKWQFKVAKMIRSNSEAVPNNVVLIILYVMCLGSLPLLQYKLEKIEH